jgi:hypothetical protein
MFLQPTDLFLRKEFISCPFMLSLVAFGLDSIGFGPMSLHWLQGMPFWASWLSGYLVIMLQSCHAGHHRLPLRQSVSVTNRTLTHRERSICELVFCYGLMLFVGVCFLV